MPLKFSMISSRKNKLFIALTGFFLTNAILAEIIGIKIFSLENLLALPPAQIPVFSDMVLDFNLTAGVVIWPVVFIITDLINEYFGKDAVKKVSFLACGLIAYAFIAIWATTQLPPATFWLEINKNQTPDGNFNINQSFNLIFSQGLGIIIGSIIAFLVGQILDAYIFSKIKSITNNRMLWLRATGSTFVSQLVDSFLVLFIAFYLLAGPNTQWPLQQVIAVCIINYLYKFGIAIILTPILYILHNIIDRYLKPEQQHSTQQEEILELQD